MSVTTLTYAGRDHLKSIRSAGTPYGVLHAIVRGFGWAKQCLILVGPDVDKPVALMASGAPSRLVRRNRRPDVPRSARRTTPESPLYPGPGGFVADRHLQLVSCPLPGLADFHGEHATEI